MSDLLATLFWIAFIAIPVIIAIAVRQLGRDQDDHDRTSELLGRDGEPK